MLCRLSRLVLGSRSASKLLHPKHLTSSSALEMVRPFVRLFRHERLLVLLKFEDHQYPCQKLCRYAALRREVCRIAKLLRLQPLERIVRSDQLDELLLDQQNTVKDPNFRLQPCGCQRPQGLANLARSFAYLCRTVRRHRIPLSQLCGRRPA